MAKEEFNPELLKVRKEKVVNTGEKTETAVQIFSYNGGEDKVRVVIRGLNGKWENVLWKAVALDLAPKITEGINEMVAAHGKKSKKK
jgi:hypothetical protein